MNKYIGPSEVINAIEESPVLNKAILRGMNIPEYFCRDKSKIRAFVLGADPSNFSNNKKPKILKTVFGIDEGDARYFQAIRDNLKQIGLGFDDIYVENLVRCYMTDQTSENKLWYLFAEKWLNLLRDDFDEVDETRKIPVFLTAEILYKFLLNDKAVYHTPKEIYSLKAEIPIPACKNKLNRPLIPLYRSRNYKLNKENYEDYVKKIKTILDY